MKRPGVRTVMILLLAMPGIAAADSDGERAALLRVIHEIEALKSLIDSAEKEADSGLRLRFEYGALRDDLKKVAGGIREHVERPRAEPRAVDDLKGRYR